MSELKEEVDSLQKENNQLKIKLAASIQQQQQSPSKITLAESKLRRMEEVPNNTYNRYCYRSIIILVRRGQWRRNASQNINRVGMFFKMLFVYKITYFRNKNMKKQHEIFKEREVKIGF